MMKVKGFVLSGLLLDAWIAIFLTGDGSDEIRSEYFTAPRRLFPSCC